MCGLRLAETAERRRVRGESNVAHRANKRPATEGRGGTRTGMRKRVRLICLSPDCSSTSLSIFGRRTSGRLAIPRVPCYPVAVASPYRVVKPPHREAVQWRRPPQEAGQRRQAREGLSLNPSRAGGWWAIQISCQYPSMGWERWPPSGETNATELRLPSWRQPGRRTIPTGRDRRYFDLLRHTGQWRYPRRTSLSN